MINYAMLRKSDNRILGVGTTVSLSDLNEMARIKSAYVVEIDSNLAENIGQYFYDGNSFKLKPQKPAESGDWEFDNTSLQWVDKTPPVIPLTIDEIKAQKWAEIKSQRNQLEFGGFEYAGNIYDSDQVSQSRIMGAAMAGVDQTWTLANNTTVNLTGDELKKLYAALQAHISSVHERSRIAREKIENAQTVAEVEAVTL